MTRCSVPRTLVLVLLSLLLFNLLLMSSAQRDSRAPFTDCDNALGILVSDCEALVAFYNATGGPNWTDKTGWLATDTPCTWYGVVCDTDRVIRLQFNTNNLTGSLPSVLGELSALQELALYYNPMGGEIPPELGNLTNLQYLILTSNQLTGPLPPELGNLVELQILAAPLNALSGPFPPQFSALTNLTNLNFQGNQLSGSIPTWLGNLTNLTYLGLQQNSFTGAIPTELANLLNLDNLLLNDNQLSGTIPPELGNMSNLKGLALDRNQLVGVLPPEFANLTNLQGLSASGNQLEGELPAWLANMTTLQNLAFDNNRFGGSIPGEIGNLTELIYLTLHGNQLVGEVPTTFLNLTNLAPDLGLTLRFNALTASDPTLHAFLDAHEPQWEVTQSAAPSDLAATFDPSTYETVLTWTPNPLVFAGFYEIGCDLELAGPYDDYVSTTWDKLTDRAVFAGLPIGTYYCAIRGHTDPHPNNQNTIISLFSAPVTVEVTATGVPNDEEELPEVVDGTSFQFYLENFTLATPDAADPKPPEACAADLGAAKSIHFVIPPGEFVDGKVSVVVGGPGHLVAGKGLTDTVVAVFRDNGSGGLIPVACNDDTPGDQGGASRLAFKRRAGVTYRLVIWSKQAAPQGVVLIAGQPGNITNGNFEFDADGNRIPDGWISTRPSNTRIRCSAGFALSAPCALYLRGRAKPTMLYQNVPKQIRATWISGNTLQLSAHVFRQNTVKGGRLKLKIWYTDGTQTESTLKIAPGSSGQYEKILLDPLTLTNSVKKARVEISYNGVSGKLRVDNVVLWQKSTTSSLGIGTDRRRPLPLPASP